MVIFAKIVCWIVLLSFLAFLGIGVYTLVKNSNDNSSPNGGSKFLLSLIVTVAFSFGLLFKGIVGLQLLNAEVLSTGNIWFLLVLLVVPSNTLWAIAIDALSFCYLGTLLPGVSADNPPKLISLLVTILVIHAIAILLLKKLQKAEGGNTEAPAAQEEEK